MQLTFGINAEAKFYVTAEAHILTPSGPEALHWTTVFESETPFIESVVTSTLMEFEMAAILTEVIRAISGTRNARRASIDIELDEDQFEMLGLAEGVCIAKAAQYEP